ncbi:hypothetical protein [Helicobacter sp. 11S02596-1]|uniref:hypothetical protein n=1 Tax=Helicobacter sp. 11S02596-1 TaxID=1476194 RepID=UPI000BA74C12|nr:hypothetical protein [Helicobacter sp. 11S02596-1]PAF41132.1 hypothetical protein BJI48_09060 [Helicobacter sp. 11S02596-1]
MPHRKTRPRPSKEELKAKIERGEATYDDKFRYMLLELGWYESLNYVYSSQYFFYAKAYIWGRFGNDGWKNTSDNTSDIAEEKARINEAFFLNQYFIIFYHRLTISPQELSAVITKATPYDEAPSWFETYVLPFIGGALTILGVALGFVSGVGWGLVGAGITLVGVAGSIIIDNKMQQQQEKFQREMEEIHEQIKALKDKDMGKEFDRRELLTDILMVAPLAIMANGYLYNKGKAGSASYEPTKAYEPYKYILADKEAIQKDFVNETLTDREHYNLAGNKDYYKHLYPEAKWDIASRNNIEEHLINTRLRQIVTGYGELGKNGWCDVKSKKEIQQKYNEKIAKLYNELFDTDFTFIMFNSHWEIEKIADIFRSIYDLFKLDYWYEDEYEAKEEEGYYFEPTELDLIVIEIFNTFDGLMASLFQFTNFIYFSALRTLYQKFHRTIEDNYIANYANFNALSLTDLYYRDIQNTLKTYMKESYSGWN